MALKGFDDSDLFFFKFKFKIEGLQLHLFLDTQPPHTTRVSLAPPSSPPHLSSTQQEITSVPTHPPQSPLPSKFLRHRHKINVRSDFEPPRKSH